MDEQILIYAAILVAVIVLTNRRDFKSLPQVQERRGIGSIW